MEKKRKILSRNNTGIYKIDEGRILPNRATTQKLLKSNSLHILIRTIIVNEYTKLLKIFMTTGEDPNSKYIAPIK